MENLTQRWTQPGPFFPQSLPPPSYVPVSVAEYASISLNMPKYL